MNEVMELPLDAVGGGYGQFQNVRPDVSAAGYFNFSYFAPDVTTWNRRASIWNYD